MQSVEMEASYVQVRRLSRNFQELQDMHALPNVIGANPSCLAGQVYFFKSFMPEPADHHLNVKRLVYSVNSRNSGWPIFFPGKDSAFLVIGGTQLAIGSSSLTLLG